MTTIKRLYPCCPHCVDDPYWHSRNDKDSHEVSCPTCDRQPSEDRLQVIGGRLADAQIENDKLRAALQAVKKLADGADAENARTVHFTGKLIAIKIRHALAGIDLTEGDR